MESKTLLEVIQLAGKRSFRKVAAGLNRNSHTNYRIAETVWSLGEAVREKGIS
jgi:hypothetical protein